VRVLLASARRTRQLRRAETKLDSAVRATRSSADEAAAASRL